MKQPRFQTLRALEKAEEDAKRVAGDQKSLVDYLERRQRTSLPWMRRTLEALGWLVAELRSDAIRRLPRPTRITRTFS